MPESAQSKYTLNSATKLGIKMRRKELLQSNIFRFIMPHLPELSKVLEVGAGKGLFARECLAQNLSYLGIEPSQELCEKLREAGFTIIEQPVPPIPVESESVDLLHSDQFIEHLCSYREVMEFFAETYRVLKPGGYTLVIAPNYATVRHLFFQYEYQHSYIVTVYRLKNMLADCGFKIINARCFFLWLSPQLNWVDRLLAHTVIPILISPIVQGILSTLFSEEFLFRIHKNIWDNVAVLAQKPL